MAKYKIDHDRDGCIGCGACAGVLEDVWEMKDDGKATAKKVDFGEEELAKQKEAAEACPVNVIHIKNTETDEKII